MLVIVKNKIFKVCSVAKNCLMFYVFKVPIPLNDCSKLDMILKKATIDQVDVHPPFQTIAYFSFFLSQTCSLTMTKVIEKNTPTSGTQYTKEKYK